MVFFFLECLWVINVESHDAHCRMANATMYLIPGTERSSWTVWCNSCYDKKLHGIWTWKFLSVAALLPLRLASVWWGGMRKHTRPAGLSALLAATSAGLSTVNSNVIATQLEFVEPQLRYSLVRRTVTYRASRLTRCAHCTYDIRYLKSVRRTYEYTIQLAVALLVEYRIYDTRYDATEFRLCPFWTVWYDSCYDELHGIPTAHFFIVAAPQKHA